ncbi:hypothetical protein [Streptomyces violascens]|uniref:hypothetical protein n=1 Tax=Streptomyces violascens TaxID=67381 RepID=UPI00365F629B
MSKTFTPRRVETLRAGARTAADGLADALAERVETDGSADLVSRFANPLPLVVIGNLLRRFPQLALAAPADRLRWRPGFRSHALKELPITAGQAFRPR